MYTEAQSFAGTIRFSEAKIRSGADLSKVKRNPIARVILIDVVARVAGAAVRR